jgi:hypothetical protein
MSLLFCATYPERTSADVRNVRRADRRGVHTLKGVPDERRLFAVTSM